MSPVPFGEGSREPGIVPPGARLTGCLGGKGPPQGAGRGESSRGVPPVWSRGLARLLASIRSLSINLD